MKEIIPVIIGADLNCYNIARAFHEQYNVVSYAFARYMIGSIMNSKIVKFTQVPDMNSEDVFLATVNKFASEHNDSALFLFGCTDEYVNLIINNKDRIDPAYFIPYTSPEIANVVTYKDKFYDMCDSFGIVHPLTTVLHGPEEINLIDSIDYKYPIIIKPSSSTEYWHHPFEGMKKVYLADSNTKAKDILNSIFSSGYGSSIVVQDYLPGNDSYMYVLTAYCDKKSKVRMMCLGHVLLEEHTPKGLGNHCAIITEFNKELYDRFRSFLEDIKYTGFANFDIKYDIRDNTFKVFEINVRQGRSNYYVTASGINIAKIVVDDYLGSIENDSPVYNDNEIYWRYVPDKIVKKYSSPEIVKKIIELKKDKRSYSSLRYKFDLKNNIKRQLYVVIHERNHIKKFKKYY